MKSGMVYLTASRIVPSHFSTALNPLVFQQTSSLEPTWPRLPEAAIAQAGWGSIPATLGDSAAMRSLRSRIARIAPHFRTALLSGPRGTDKEGVARSLHALSPTWTSPFIALQSSALAEELLRSDRLALDYLSACSETQATLFLNDICNVPMAFQANLLALWSPEIRCRLRIVAGTHMDLRTMTVTGRFRPDLLQKLSGVEISLTPLCERPSDLTTTAEAIMSSFGAGQSLVLGDDATALLLQHHWPGDLAELAKVLHSAFHRANGSPVIRAEHLPDLILEERVDEAAESSDRLDKVIQRHVLTVLTRCHGNKLRTAEILGVSRSTLYRMLESRLIPDFPGEDHDPSS